MNNLAQFSKALNEGLSYAAHGLSSMAPGLSFMPTPAHVSVAERDKRFGLLPPDSPMVGVFLDLTGDAFGTMLLLLTAEDAARLTQSLVGGALKVQGDSAMASSALEEAGNVFGSGVIGAPSRNLALSIFTAPPRLDRDSLSAIWGRLLLPQASGAGPLIVFQSELLCPAWNSKAYFFLCLSGESAANVDRVISAEPVARLDVGMGDIRVVGSPGILKAASLGSCLAVILYDYRTKKGGMAHVVLPVSSAVDKSVIQKPGKYADIAVPALLKRLETKPNHLAAWLVGGANMFPRMANPVLQVGKRNLEVAREQLQAAGIRCIDEDVGGTHGRTVELFTASAEVWVRVGYPPRRLAGVDKITRS